MPSYINRLLFYTDHPSQVTVAQPAQILTKADIDNISKKMFGQISSEDLPRIAIYYGITDDTMATLKNLYDKSPVTLLSNILIHWMDQNEQATRLDFAIILHNFGISPDTVMS